MDRARAGHRDVRHRDRRQPAGRRAAPGSRSADALGERASEPRPRDSACGPRRRSVDGQLRDAPAARLRALRDVGFSIRAGETLALVGRIGLRQEHRRTRHPGACSVPKPRSRRGRIRFDGRDLRRARRRRSDRRCAATGSASSSRIRSPRSIRDCTIGMQVAEPLVFHRGLSPGGSAGRKLLRRSPKSGFRIPTNSPAPTRTS